MTGLMTCSMSSLAQLVECDIGRVLRGDDHCVYAERNAGALVELVLDGDL